MSKDNLDEKLRRATCRADFVAACAAYPLLDIRIDHHALAAYAASLRKPDFISPWSDYLTPRGKKEKDLVLDFAELAISTAINGGYLYKDTNGKTQKWEKDGSGAAALLVKMDEARAQKMLPLIDITNPFEMRKKAAKLFDGTPFADLRSKIWGELARPDVKRDFTHILQSAKRTDGKPGYKFTMQHLRDLSYTTHSGFAEDPFLKKAALLPILFAGVAHHKVAPDCVDLSDIIVPADYRVPQTLHNLGILRLSDRLVNHIEKGTLLVENSHYVTQLRAASVVVCDEILKMRDDLSIHHLDGELWFTGRLFDKPVEALDEKKAKIRAGFEAIKDKSNFSEKGFRKSTTKAVNAYTLRF